LGIRIDVDASLSNMAQGNPDEEPPLFY
jgi:hypothetical protein